MIGSVEFLAAPRSTSTSTPSSPSEQPPEPPTGGTHRQASRPHPPGPCTPCTSHQPHATAAATGCSSQTRSPTSSSTATRATTKARPKQSSKPATLDRRAPRRRARRSPRPVAPGDRRRPADHRTASPNDDRPRAATLHRYLHILAGANPAGRLIEIRSATPHGAMRQTFTPATRTDLAAQTITTLAASADVYVGVLLRHRRAGGRHACERSHLAFIEIDRPDALERLAHHRCPPTVVVASGRSRDTLHAYWQLHQPVDLDELEHANRRLAIQPRRRPRLHRRRPHPQAADLPELQTHPADARRAARPHPARRYQLDELTAGLTDPSPPRRRPRRRQPRREQRARPAAARDPGRHLRASAHRPPAEPRRQDPLPVSRRQHPEPPALPDDGWYCFGPHGNEGESAAPSTTSGRASAGSTPAAASSYSSASASPTSCCRSAQFHSKRSWTP